MPLLLWGRPTIHEGDEISEVHGTDEREVADVLGEEHLLLVLSFGRFVSYFNGSILPTVRVKGNIDVPGAPPPLVDTALLRFDMLVSGLRPKDGFRFVQESLFELSHVSSRGREKDELFRPAVKSRRVTTEKQMPKKREMVN
jgi:hypothetical protein